MATDPQSRPSFSFARKLGIGLHVFVLIFLVFSVVVMVNYISRDYFVRFQASARNRIELSPLTLNLLKSLTNHVRITLYYDKQDPVFSLVSDLVREYELRNPKYISVQVVDYLLDAGAAQKTRETYNLGANTNLIIFDCNGTVQPIPGKTLADCDYEAVPGAGFRQKFAAFRGETAFTAALLAVTDPRPRYAYFLQGHKEHDIYSGDDTDGYLKFAAVLRLFGTEALKLDNLGGTNAVPTNCDLLIIAGPRGPIAPTELDKIEQYLERSGSRLFLLLDAGSINHETGLEKVLAKWGVGIGNKVVVDPAHSPNGSDIVVSAFSIHPVVNPLYQSGIYLVRPRPVGPLNSRSQPADAPRVQKIAFTGPEAHLEGETQKGSFPVMVAVEKSIQGVATDRGPTRLLVLGDSLCLANHWIDFGPWANRDFAVCAVNWLLDRTPLIQVGPRPVSEYTLVMTKGQMQSTELILLAGMPGGVLFFGILVWLRRRR